MRKTALIGGVLVLGFGAAVGLTPRLFDAGLDNEFDRLGAAFTGSESCQVCHRDHHASWERTFHRTMTQEATAKSVRGIFDGSEYTYWGGTVRPITRDGKYFFEYLDPATGALTATLPVLRTVGSNRYQQYLGQTPNGGDTYYRLHLLWHMEDERWMHVNGIFLSPDEQPFDAHVAVWNHNCIYCHNTGPVPNITNWDELGERVARGERVDSALEAEYNSHVAELGIACESCHGPGAEHAQRNRNPLRRYMLALGDHDDPTIVSPAKLDKQRSVDVCGQCHGQRIPHNLDALQEWVETGPTFRAGELLAAHVETVWADTAVLPGVDPDLFRLRFWPDGTARLSAYEYQGILQSACFQKGELTCRSCHEAHGGDPHGMIEPENRTGNGTCLTCHAELGADLSAHTRHAPDSTGSLCYNCHMPRIAYGVMQIHRSHRIEIPDPGAHTEQSRPNACTLCHLDRSPVWAARQTQRLWGDEFALPRRRGDGGDPEVADVVASLFAGDPVQRVVAANHAGRPDAPLSVAERAFLVPQLLLALDNRYPQVRKQSRHSLLALVRALEATGYRSELARMLEEYDFIAAPDVRAGQVNAMRREWVASVTDALPTPPPAVLVTDDYLPQSRPVSELMRIGAAQTKQIDIGE